jgi:hypothetical protein
MAPLMRTTTVIVPHFKGAKRREELAPGILVKRFRYAYPYKFENIAYGQFKKTRFYSLKAALYTASELWTTLVTCLQHRQVVISAHWIVPQGFVAVLVAPIVGAKVVITVHGGDVFTLNGRFMCQVKQFVLKRADAVAVNSSATQAACKELWSGREYQIIPEITDGIYERY